MSTLKCAELFDRAFSARSRTVAQRPERSSDAAFLLDLYAACSPLAGIVPPALLHEQARLQADSFAARHPAAMYRIAVLDGRPVGRFAIDWDGAYNHGIDLAVSPIARSSGLAMDWLRSWIEVADQLDQPSSLMVHVQNRAVRLYRRLGFEIVPGAGSAEPVVAMRRPSARPR